MIFVKKLLTGTLAYHLLPEPSAELVRLRTTCYAGLIISVRVFEMKLCLSIFEDILLEILVGEVSSWESQKIGKQTT